MIPSLIQSMNQISTNQHQMPQQTQPIGGGGVGSATSNSAHQQQQQMVYGTSASQPPRNMATIPQQPPPLGRGYYRPNSFTGSSFQSHVNFIQQQQATGIPPGE